MFKLIQKIIYLNYKMSKVKVNVVDISKQSKVRVKPIKRANHIHFSDHPDFRPNLSPKDVLQMGSFGGTYYRPIHSTVVNKNFRNQHKKYNWDLPDNMVTKPFNEYDISINKYKVKVGTTLDFWESKGLL